MTDIRFGTHSSLWDLSQAIVLGVERKIGDEHPPSGMLLTDEPPGSVFFVQKIRGLPGVNYSERRASIILSGLRSA